jgi:hypothetical protein
MAHPPFPTALGEAILHGEAWLLDDPHAIRQVLELEVHVPIPTIRKARQPKETLNQLIRLSRHRTEPWMELLRGIAQLMEVSRCQYAEETGFSDFVEEVRRELGPLVPEKEE